MAKVNEQQSRKAQRRAILRCLREWWDSNPDFSFIDVVSFFCDGYIECDSDNDESFLASMRLAEEKLKNTSVVDPRQLTLPGVQ